MSCPPAVRFAPGSIAGQPCPPVAPSPRQSGLTASRLPAGVPPRRRIGPGRGAGPGLGLLLALALPLVGLPPAAAQTPPPARQAGSDPAKKPEADTVRKAESDAPASPAPARVPDRVWSTQPSPVPAYISGGSGGAVIVAPVVVPHGVVRPGPAPRALPGAGVSGAGGTGGANAASPASGSDRPAGVIRPERAP
ncbi:MAG: hypothetical protein KGQ67_06485 [Betaproteobacteria bacterium]|nr:hypothetical protein [Betaproteobacteria bacterium]